MLSLLIRRQISEEIYGFLAVFLIAAGGTAWADDITADVLTYDGKAKTVIATGNVVIHANEGAVVTGKKGQYYFENRSAWLDGGVEYQKDQTVMTAEKCIYMKIKQLAV